MYTNASPFSLVQLCQSSSLEMNFHVVLEEKQTRQKQVLALALKHREAMVESDL
jgi:hypothetical protein